MMLEYWTAVRLFSRDVRLFLFSSAVMGFAAMGGIYTVLLNLYLLRLGYGPEFIGLVNAAGFVAMALFSLPSGMLAERWGVRALMIAGMGLATAGFGLLPAVELIPAAWQRGWLMLTYLLGWLGYAIYIVNSNPFLIGATTVRERNHAYSIRSALLPLAGFFGSLTGGILPATFAAVFSLSLEHAAVYRYSLLCAAALQAPAVFALLKTAEIPAQVEQETSPAANREIVILIAIMAFAVLFQVAGEGMARTFFNVYLDTQMGISTVRIGLLAAIAQLLAVPGALATPLFAKRWGSDWTFIYATLGMAVSLLWMGFVFQWLAVGMGYAGVIALTSIARPAVIVYQMEIVSPRWRPAMSGATAMTTGLSWAATAFAGGYIISGLGYVYLFSTGAILTAIGALVFWAYFHVPRGMFRLSNP